MPANTDRVGAFGFFVPQAAMNGGKGACTFLMADTSPFYLNSIGAVQGPVIMADFLSAAKDVAGACKKASAVADLKPVITGPTSVPVGAKVTLNIAVNNVGAGASTDGLLAITLPPGVRTAGALPNGCSLVAGASATDPEMVKCNLQGLAASGTTSLSLPVQVNDAGSFGVTAQITSVTGENIIANNNATHTITAAASVATNEPAPVPAGGWPFTALIAAAVSWVTWRRRAS